MSLDINNTNGHDDTSARAVKICEDAIKKLLLIVYKKFIKTGLCS